MVMKLLTGLWLWESCAIALIYFSAWFLIQRFHRFLTCVSLGLASCLNKFKAGSVM